MADQSHWEEFEKRRSNYRVRGHSLFEEARFLYQRLTRGYDDRDVWDVSEGLTRFLRPRLKAYIKWQSEHGMHVPQDFQKDPAAWLNVLSKIDFALDIIDKGDYRREGSEADVQNGLALLGKYYRDLWG